MDQIDPSIMKNQQKKHLPQRDPQKRYLKTWLRSHLRYQSFQHNLPGSRSMRPCFPVHQVRLDWSKVSVWCLRTSKDIFERYPAFCQTDSRSEERITSKWIQSKIPTGRRKWRYIRTLITMMASCTTYVTRVEIKSSNTFTHRSAASSILIAHCPIALTAFLTNSTSTSEAYLKTPKNQHSSSRFSNLWMWIIEERDVYWTQLFQFT